MPTPESKIKSAIKKVLDEMGCYYFMPVQMGLGKRTLDFLVCYRGSFFGIEAKAPGSKPTLLQKRCMHEITLAGGSCTTVDSVDCANHLKIWMNSHLVVKEYDDA